MKKLREIATSRIKKKEAKTRDGFTYDVDEAIRHLVSADIVLAGLIERAGPFAMQIRHMHNPFEALARNIIYQQLHANAAAAIHQRVLNLFGGKKLRPQEILAATEEEMRGAGLSRAKLAALRDLSVKTLDGTVPTLAQLKRMEDEEIIERLTKVRGIGRWTVEMLLMFRLGCPDVLPVDDYAVRKGFQLTYGLEEMPKAKEVQIYGERWRPFRSMASWYMWQAVRLSRQEIISALKARRLDSKTTSSSS